MMNKKLNKKLLLITLLAGTLSGGLFAAKIGAVVNFTDEKVVITPEGGKSVSIKAHSASSYGKDLAIKFPSCDAVDDAVGVKIVCKTGTSLFCERNGIVKRDELKTKKEGKKFGKGKKLVFDDKANKNVTRKIAKKDISGATTAVFRLEVGPGGIQFRKKSGK